jgi:hypothetical protein
LACSMIFLAPSRKEHLGSKQEQLMNRERCEHTTYPVEVLTGGGGKKIAHCLGCGRTGPVCKSSTEAIVALRDYHRQILEHEDNDMRCAPTRSSSSTSLAWQEPYA